MQDLLKHAYHPDSLGMIFGKTTKTACGKRRPVPRIVNPLETDCGACQDEVIANMLRLHESRQHWRDLIMRPEHWHLGLRDIRTGGRLQVNQDAGSTIRTVAFGTGGELTGEILAYEMLASQVRPGMPEEEACAAAMSIFGPDYVPEIRDYAPRPGSRCRVQPRHESVWTTDGELLQRDDAGEPCHILQVAGRGAGRHVLACLEHARSSDATYPTSEAALESGWRCPVIG